MADSATAELTDEAAVTVTASGNDLASDLADDVLVEEVSIDGMCGVY
jgi:mycofactocin precursor